MQGWPVPTALWRELERSLLQDQLTKMLTVHKKTYMWGHRRDNRGYRTLSGT